MFTGSAQHVASSERAFARTMNKHSKDIFLSYWQAGYEGADHINKANRSLSMNELTRHTHQARGDYLLLDKFGIKTVRESVGWRLVEKSGHFDFSSLESRVHAANEFGLQIIWTLCHYGWPDDIDVFSRTFIHRLTAYCERTVRHLDSVSDIAPVYSLINEISFTSWAVAQGYFPCPNPEGNDSSDLKRQLIRATLKRSGKSIRPPAFCSASR
jgi:UDP-galactopyranose mutase